MLNFKINKYFARIVLPSFLAIGIFIILIFKVIIPSYEQNVIYTKKQMLKELVNVVWNIFNEYDNNVDSIKELSADSKQKVISLVRDLRYGPENKDYFWIMDTVPNIIMHPFLPELDGKFVGNYSDSSGTYLFNDALEETKDDGEGFIQYIWQWKDDSSLLLNKVSFVKLYPKWGWIIGTGIYFDDIENEMSGFKRYWVIVSGLISFAIILLLGYIVRQSLLIEKKREKAEAEIKKLNEELEIRVEQRTKNLNIAYQELEEIAYTISHDLRSPLRHIRSFNNKLFLSINNPTEITTEYYHKVEDSSKNMSKMIEELIYFLKLGRKNIKYQVVDIHGLMLKIINKYKAEENRIKWKIGELYQIKGDQILLESAFDYLISNAIKFSAKNKNIIIEIGAREYDSYVKYYIKDNGIGFDMRYTNKLFGIFQRLHNEKDFEGVGIGLAKVKRIVEKHGGSITTESEVNKGATFFVKLPK